MSKTVISLLVVALVPLALGGSNKEQPWTEEATQNHRWGYYSGYPEARWEPDGRSMTLMNELRYTDPDGVVWIAPPGAVVDGASIPRSLWSFMGGPFEGKYRNASVLHDVAYDKKDRPPALCDRMFYHAMRCSGVSAAEAGTMYYALLKFGRHWKAPIKKAKALSKKERAALAKEEQEQQEPEQEAQQTEAQPEQEVPQSTPTESASPSTDATQQPEQYPKAQPIDRLSIDQARQWIQKSEPSAEQIEQRAESEQRAQPAPNDSGNGSTEKREE
jgi:hypothetical protein